VASRAPPSVGRHHPPAHRQNTTNFGAPVNTLTSLGGYDIFTIKLKP